MTLNPAGIVVDNTVPDGLCLLPCAAQLPGP
jgi:hypothetical protein